MRNGASHLGFSVELGLPMLDFVDEREPPAQYRIPVQGPKGIGSTWV